MILSEQWRGLLIAPCRHNLRQAKSGHRIWEGELHWCLGDLLAAVVDISPRRLAVRQDTQMDGLPAQGIESAGILLLENA